MSHELYEAHKIALHASLNVHAAVSFLSGSVLCIFEEQAIRFGNDRPGEV